MSTPILTMAWPKQPRAAQPLIQRLEDKKLSLKDGTIFDNQSDASLGIEITAKRPIAGSWLIANGSVDAGVVGLDKLAEYNASNPVKPLVPVAYTDLSRCRLSFLINADQDAGSILELRGPTVATTYPEITNAYLAERGIPAKAVYADGDVELLVQEGCVSAAVDVVDTGNSARKAGLKEGDKLMDSSLVICAREGLSAEQEQVLSDFVQRIDAVPFEVASAQKEARARIALQTPLFETMQGHRNATYG